MFRRNSNDQPSVDSRRKFLKMSGTCGMMSSTSLLSTMLNLKLTSSALAAAQVPTTDYKALVCLFLQGGIDSYNVLVPTGNSEYNDYAAARTNLALKRTGDAGADSTNTVLPITDTAALGGTGRTFGLHPKLPNLQTLFNANKAAFVCNVGSLVEPLQDIAAYNNVATKKPVGLFSHSDLVRHWMSAVPQSRNQLQGWGGRMADLLTDPANTSDNFFTNVSTNGSNLIQTGNRIVPYSISSSGAVIYNGYSLPTEPPQVNSYDKVYSNMQNDLINRHYQSSHETESRRAVGVKSRPHVERTHA